MIKLSQKLALKPLVGHKRRQYLQSAYQSPASHTHIYITCCMFVSCVHPVAVPNAAFCMTYSLLMLIEDARGDHMDEAYSRAGLANDL